jgi:hypothetical protein
MLARGDMGVWLTQTVAAFGYQPSLAVDTNGRSHLAYADTNGVLYANWNGATWQIESVAPQIAADS